MRAYSVLKPITLGQFSSSIEPIDLPKPNVLSPKSIGIKSLGSSFDTDDVNFADRNTFMNKFRVIEEIVTARFEFDKEPSLKNPYIPGANLAGIVEEVGPQVTRFQKGDPVFGFTWPGKGAWGEYCVTEEKFCHPIPGGMSIVEASALSTTAMPVTEMIKAASNLENKSVMIVGADHPAGALLLDYLESQKISVAPINHASAERFLERVEPHTYDVVFDFQGQETYERCLQSLKPHGQYLTKVGPMSFLQNDSVTWSQFFGKLNDIGSNTIEGFLKGPKYRYVAAMNPDWALMDEVILKPGFKVPINEVCAFHDLEHAKLLLKDSEGCWETGKIVFLHDAAFEIDPYAPISKTLS